MVQNTPIIHTSSHFNELDSSQIIKPSVAVFLMNCALYNWDLIRAQEISHGLVW